MAETQPLEAFEADLKREAAGLGIIPPLTPLEMARGPGQGNFLDLVARNPHGWGNAPPQAEKPASPWQRDPQGYLGEIRNLPNRPDQYLAPAIEGASPTLGGYGLGTAAGEVAGNIGEGKYGSAALAAIPLAVGAIVPGPDGMGKRAPREIDARGFYSPSLEAAKALPQETGTVQQFRSMLLDPKFGGKPKELDAVGFDKAFPDVNAKVSRQEIEQFLRENRVGLGESTFGKRSPTSDEVKASSPYPPDVAAKFEQYSTPGGIPGSYREVVTTLPDKAAEAKKAVEARAEQLFRAPADQFNEQATAFRKLNEENPTYTDSHWPGITNPLLHYRTKLFDNGDGTKTFLTDEMQSGWGQAARDKGTRDPAGVNDLARRNAEANTAANDATREAGNLIGVADWRAGHQSLVRSLQDAAHIGEIPKEAADAAIKKVTDTADAAMDLTNKLRAAKEGVPSAPYISNTSDWVDLGLKQALIDAARDPSVTRFAWAPGGVQGDRYNLGRHVTGIRYNPDTQRLEYAPVNPTRDLRPDPQTGLLEYPREGWRPYGTHDQSSFKPEELPSVIGKEATDKLLAKPFVQEGNSGWHTIDDMANEQIGVHGMKGFYGDMTPEGYQSGIVGTRLQKLVKGLDPEAARVEPSEIQAGIARGSGGDPRQFGRPQRVIQSGGAWGIHFEGGGWQGGFPSEAAAKAKVAEINASPEGPRLNYPSIPITPAMREKILKQGMPLFSAYLAAMVGMGMMSPDEAKAAETGEFERKMNAEARELGLVN